MAANATFFDGFMLENKWAALCGVALQAGPVLAQQNRAASLDLLGKIRSAALNRIPDMWIVAV